MFPVCPGPRLTTRTRSHCIEAKNVRLFTPFKWLNVSFHRSTMHFPVCSVLDKILCKTLNYIILFQCQCHYFNYTCGENRYFKTFLKNKVNFREAAWDMHIKTDWDKKLLSIKIIYLLNLWFTKRLREKQMKKIILYLDDESKNSQTTRLVGKKCSTIKYLDFCQITSNGILNPKITL